MIDTIGTLFGLAVQEIDLYAWERAWAAWMGRKSTHTRRAYAQAWDDLADFCEWPEGQRTPWKLTSSDLEAWLVDMSDRGLKAATIGLRLAAVRSYLAFVSQRYLVPCEHGEKPLHFYNPAAGVEAPKIQKYAEALYLTGDQVRALLRAIPQASARGLRDYALLRFYLASGRRSAEIRGLQWGDFRQDGARVFYRWHGKGGLVLWSECPDDIWRAIQSYLTRIGRLAGMQASDYVFTAIGDHAARLPNMGPDYDPQGQAISGPEVVRILRRYAAQAGINPQGLRVHSLRHTAAMLRQQIGVSEKDIQAMLGHSTLKTTDIYLHTLEGSQAAGWQAVQDYFGI